jgi:hypothetical protein
MYSRQMFREVRAIFSEKVASTTADSLSSIQSSDLTINSSSILGRKFDLTVEATTGNVMLGFTTDLASTNNNGILLTEGSIIDLKVDMVLYINSPSTTAQFQAICWK